jgi:hypothetical protein
MPNLPRRQTHHSTLQEDGQTLRRLHKLLQRHLQDSFSSPAKGQRKAFWQEMPRLRLVNRDGLVEG